MATNNADFKVKKGLIVTEGITLGGHTFDDIDIGTEFVDTDDHLMSSGAIKEKIEDYGYTTNTGTMSSFTVRDSSDTDVAIANSRFIKFVEGDGLDITFTDTDTGDTNDPFDLTFKVADDGISATQLNVSGNGSSGNALLSDGDGSFSWGTAGDATLAGTQTFSGAKTFSNERTIFDEKISSSGTNTLQLETNNGVSSGTIKILNGGVANHINITPASGTVNIDAENLRLSQAGASTITTAGAYDLTLNTNDGTNSGSISITDGANGDISITPNGTGQVNLGNFQFDVDQTVGSGQDNYVLTYDHANTQISLEAAGGGGASDLDGLSDVLIDATNFTDSILIQADSDGSAPTTGTLNSATGNTGYGASVFKHLTDGSLNTGIGYYSLRQLTGGVRNTAVGYESLGNITTSNYNVAIGFQAGNGGWSGADSNIAIGYGTLSGNLTADKIIAIGRQAGQAHTSGTDSIYMGTFCALNVTTGSRNLVIGYEAYDGATTESDNIAIGHSALGGAVNGGEYNVAIGNYSLDALTTGDDNVVIGYQAGTTMTTSKRNTVIGSQALYSGDASYNTAVGRQSQYAHNGIRNTSVGEQSLYTAGTGAYNNAIGHSAGWGITDGHNNQAFGYKALYAVTTGDDNIAIGHEAGDNITTGNNNVVIGKADVPSATADDQLSISSGDGGVTWIEGNGDGVVLGALTPLFYERAALDTNAVDFRVPTVQSSTANPNGYPMPFAGTVRAASFLFAGSAISTSGNTNTLRIRKNGGTSGSDIKDFTFTESDLNNTNGNQYSLVKSGSDVLFTFAAGDVLQVKRQSGSTDLNNSQAMLWVRYNF